MGKNIHEFKVKKYFPYVFNRQTFRSSNNMLFPKRKPLKKKY